MLFSTRFSMTILLCQVLSAMILKLSMCNFPIILVDVCDDARRSLWRPFVDFLAHDVREFVGESSWWESRCEESLQLMKEDVGNPIRSWWYCVKTSDEKFSPFDVVDAAGVFL